MDMSAFVIDDDEASRNSLTFMLRAEKILARSFSSAAEFFAHLGPEHQGVIVTDVRMPGLDGISLVSELRNRGCWMPVIVITGHGDVALAVEAMKAGASDFLEKPFDSTLILTAIRKCLDASRASKVEQSRRTLVMKLMQTLSEREHDVFKGVVDGNSNKEIAITLNISPRTVEIHRASVMSKLNAETIADLIHMSVMLTEISKEKGRTSRT